MRYVAPISTAGQVGNGNANAEDVRPVRDHGRYGDRGVLSALPVAAKEWLTVAAIARAREPRPLRMAAHASAHRGWALVTVAKFARYLVVTMIVLRWLDRRRPGRALALSDFRASGDTQQCQRNSAGFSQRHARRDQTGHRRGEGGHQRNGSEAGCRGRETQRGGDEDHQGVHRHRGGHRDPVVLDRQVHVLSTHGGHREASALRTKPRLLARNGSSFG